MINDVYYFKCDLDANYVNRVVDFPSLYSSPKKFRLKPDNPFDKTIITEMRILKRWLGNLSKILNVPTSSFVAQLFLQSMMKNNKT